MSIDENLTCSFTVSCNNLFLSSIIEGLTFYTKQIPNFSNKTSPILCSFLIIPYDFFFKILYSNTKQANNQDGGDLKSSHEVRPANDNMVNPSLTQMDICEKRVRWADIDNSTTPTESILYTLYKQI